MTETRTLVVEREINHPVEKVWRALTQPALLEEWLMKTDFEPKAGKPFQFRSTPMPQWDGIIHCEVLDITPMTRLSYKWGSMGLETVVTWTLTPAGKGVVLRMEQAGFPTGAGTDQYYTGATYGWQKFFGGLEALLARVA